MEVPLFWHPKRAVQDGGLGMNSMKETYIYESPDGGHTVYRRLAHQRERELVSISPELLAKKEMDALWTKWIPILRASRDDPALRELVERAETYYNLKN